ncbi:MAG TPA: hypothetical protein VGT41_03235 [Candidatus Babeliales bacterium]|nr:hypothetical protein [Candidatus Babeliales bacterium]
MDFEKFAAKHQPPQHLRNAIERNKEKIRSTGFGEVKGMPGFIVKHFDANRVINADRMEECIKRFNLDRLAVAKKYIAKVDGQWMVFAEMIKPDSSKKYDSTSLEFVQQLAKLAEETGYRDWQGNWLFNKEGKLTCIDSENDSFAIGRSRLEDGKTPQHCKTQYVLSLAIFGGSIDPEARQWLQDKINALRKSPEGVAEHTKNTPDTILPWSKKFDGPNINISNVKQHLEKLREESYGMRQGILSESMAFART